MTDGPDLGQRPAPGDKGIVGRRLAVARDADDLADVRAGILRQVALRIPLARRDEEVAVAGKHQSRAEMMLARELGLLPEDHRDVREGRAVEAGARNRRAVLVALSGLGVGKVDRRIRGIRGVQYDVEQAPLARGDDRRHAGDRLRQLPVLRDVAEPSGPLGHQHAAVGKESEAPGMLEAARDRRHRDAGFAARGDVLRVLAGAGARHEERQEQAARNRGKSTRGHLVDPP